MSEHVVVRTLGRTGHLRIDRPAKKNALTSAMYAALARALDEFDRDGEIRSAVVAGGENFSAGNDLQDFVAASLSGVRLEDSPVIRFLESLRDFGKPLVAAVRGNAIGIGTTMLLHCDVVVAGRSARFRLPFVQLGIVPEAASSLLLPLTIGRARASSMLLTGETIGAEEALAIGLVNRVTDDEAVDEVAEGIAAAFATSPAGALRETKRLMRAPWADAVRKQMDEEIAAFAKRLASPEFREAATKLLTKT